MSIQGIRAGKAFVECFMNDKGVNSGLAKLSKTMSAWGRTGLKYSLPVVGAFGAAAASFANAGSELYDMSRRTGMAVEQLSMLKYAADQSDVEFGTLEKAIKTMEKNGFDPAKFTEIGEAIAKIPDQAARVRAAMDVFGKAGYDIIPMLQDLPELNAQFQKLGITMSTQDAVAADALGDAFAASKAQFWGLVNTIGAALAGPLTEFLQWSQTVVQTVIQWAHENPVLFKTIAIIATAVAAVSAAMVAFGSIAALVATAIGGIAAAVTGLGAALAVVALNPLAWIVGAVALGVVGAGAIYGISKLGSGSVGSAATAATVVSNAFGNQAATVANRGGGQDTNYLRIVAESTSGMWDIMRQSAGQRFGIKAVAL